MGPVTPPPAVTVPSGATVTHTPATDTPATDTPATDTPATDTRSHLRGLLLALPMVVYLALAWRYTRTGLWNADEGFYCAAARRVLSGAVPYRDFGYSQFPLLPYLNGLAMAVTGVGLMAQRAANAVWGGLTLVTVLWTLSRRDTVALATTTGLLLALSPGWVQSVCLGKTYAATGLFLVLCATAATSPRATQSAALAFALSGAAAIGCRVSAAPVVLALWAGGLYVRPRTPASWWSLPALGILVAALVVPFAASAPASFVFWVLRYHSASTRDAQGWSLVTELFWLAPAVLAWVPIALTVLAMDGRQRRSPAAAILFGSLVGMIAHAALRTTYAEYSAPMIPLAAVGAIGVLDAQRRGRWPRASLAAWALPALAFLHPLPRTMDGLGASVHGAVTALRTRTAPGARVLTPVPYLATEARRNLVAGTEMGMFSLTDTMDEATARRLHLVTPGMLLAALDSGEADAVALIGFQSPWNFTWSVPGLQPVDPRVTARMYRTVSARYRLVYRDPRFVVFVRR